MYHLSADDVTTAKDVLTELKTALEAINTTLAAKDRQRYGSINEQDKLLVNKAFDFHASGQSLRTITTDD